MTTSDSISIKETFLSSLLLELIEILRDHQGETWAAIAQIAAGKSATIAIDDTRLFLQVDQDLAVTVSKAEADASNDFESNGITLKNVIFGRSSLDKSVASGKIFIHASFGDLLKIRTIVSSVLADTAKEPRLVSLWERLDQEWN